MYAQPKQLHVQYMYALKENPPPSNICLIHALYGDSIRLLSSSSGSSTRTSRTSKNLQDPSRVLRIRCGSSTTVTRGCCTPGSSELTVSTIFGRWTVSRNPVCGYPILRLKDVSLLTTPALNYSPMTTPKVLYSRMAKRTAGPSWILVKYTLSAHADIGGEEALLQCPAVGISL